MCTSSTERVEVAGSAKGPAGWFPLNLATVYYDHPQDTAAAAIHAALATAPKDQP